MPSFTKTNPKHQNSEAGSTLSIQAPGAELLLREFIFSPHLWEVFSLLQATICMQNGYFVKPLNLSPPAAGPTTSPATLISPENCVTGVGGTNLHGIEFQGITKHKSHIINKLRFAITSIVGRWRFAPPNTATSGTKYPAKGRINRAAPFKSAEGDVYPQICARQTVPGRL